LEKGHERKKTAKSKRLVETDSAVEIRTKRGFPPRLEKAKHTTLGFFTVPTSPTAAVHRLSYFQRKQTTPCAHDSTIEEVTRHPDAR